MKRLIFWGLFVVLVGVWLWLSQLGIPFISFRRDWPWLIILFGLWLLVRGIRHLRRPRARIEVIADLEEGKIDVDQAVARLRRRKS